MPLPVENLGLPAKFLLPNVYSVSANQFKEHMIASPVQTGVKSMTAGDLP